MKIVSWNCLNGFDKGKPEKLLVKFSDTDIFVIQECRRQDIDTIRFEGIDKNWYGDSLDYKSDLGVAVFSKSCKIEFTHEFNRKYRYVVPYLIKKDRNEFTLFAVWTKSAKRGDFDYDQNIIKAIQTPEYQGLIKHNAIIIGDYNTGYNRDYPERYKKLMENLKEKGFLNSSKENPEDFDMTFYYDKNGQKYLNDFCFVSKDFSERDIIFRTENNWEKTENGKERWHGSDHCPISVEFNF
jgi:exonuclease III